MKWLHWFSLAVAVCALVVVGTGALATNHTAQAGSQAAAQHRITAEGLAWLTVIQLVWMLTSAPLRGLAGTSLILAGAEIFLGRSALGAAEQSVIPFYHAVLAQLCFALSVVIAALTSPFWQTPPATIADRGWPSLRGYASLTAILVFLQVILGAAFRHNLLGVMWHIIGALVLALFVLGLAMLLLNQPPEAVPHGNPLRTPAITLLVVAGLQLVLGLNLVSMNGNAKHASAVAVMAVIHTINGALTLAVTTVLMLLARRHARGVV